MRRNLLVLAAALLLIIALGAPNPVSGQEQDLFKRFEPVSGRGDLPGTPVNEPIWYEGRFSGYTNYWQTIAWRWRQHGNLFLMGQPDMDEAIGQNQADIAEELGLPGLGIEYGFLDDWLRSDPIELQDPNAETLRRAVDRGDVLAWLDRSSELGRDLLHKAGIWPVDDAISDTEKVPHQHRSVTFRPIDALVLSDGTRRLFVVTAAEPADRKRFEELLACLRDVVDHYDFHRGWFGTGTLLHSVTCHPGHPLEVIGQGLDQGNDWFTFGGYMDFLMLKQLPEWLREVGLDIPVDVGTGKATHSLGTVAYGLKSYEGLKIQDMPTEEEWIKFAKDRGGYIFRPVWAPDCDKFKYDGQIGIEGNKRQIDTEDVPFILQTGLVKDEAPACMVLFTEKGRRWTRDEMWRAILGRRAVGVLPQGRMMGPAKFRSALQLLLLDRVFLENRFEDKVQIKAVVKAGYELEVRVGGYGYDPFRGTVEVRAAPGITVTDPRREREFDGGNRISFPLSLTAAAMGRANPILVELRWKGGVKRAMAVLDLPPAVSVHKLLHGFSPEVVYPVSVHNFTGAKSYPVEVRVYAKDRPEAPVLATSLTGTAPTSGHQALEFRLPLQPGAYTVRTTALGVTNMTQLGVDAPSGEVTVTPVDLNGDGIMEYRLENDKVRVTLLAIGARVIEYVVKEKNDNVFFKLWPEKEYSDRRPFRERGFYPYGGFEDFLGQASIETHKVYDAEVVKDGGTSASVRMTADYYGNRLEKVFTLDGGSPLLEIRWAIEFRNPELNMLGPQPILSLGEKHGTEDVFVIPAKAGRREVRMRPEEYFGEVFFLKEGWNAGRDTVEDVSFVGAYPVSEPEFLHMWMNHPSNGESAHYYAELQPWVPIFQKTVRYFSYYMWAAPGSWESGLEELRRRNLITAAK
jgi:hypothetical protein